jgi:glyoxylase-like metal-dependent hydrolase (beta-lactamase superfamily II)
MHKIGDLEIEVLRAGTFKLDGGAMFGIIPKELWEKGTKPDPRNRISLSLNILVVKAGGKNIVVDTGIGSKHDAKAMDTYEIDKEWKLPLELKRIGLGLDDIHYVIPSHLHLDHMGGATVKEMGKPVPSFPKATYIIQEKEWEAAHDSNPRSRGSYIHDDFEPLKGRIKLVNGDFEVTKGVHVTLTNAHTPGHQCVVLESESKHAIFMGDLMPTCAHIKPAWCMGYDCFPLEVARRKEEIIEKSIKDNWMVIFDHELSTPIGKIVKKDSGYELVPEGKP